MKTLDLLARSLISALFVQSGLDSLSSPQGRAKLVQQAGLPSPELAVQVNGAVMATAGSMLALNVAPRMAAGALAASLIPMTLVGHAFWNKEGQERQGELMHFMKNVAMLGGLLIVVANERHS